MKIPQVISNSLVLILTFPFLAGVSLQGVELASELAPEDVGIKKYIFKATPNENQVAVFRFEHETDDAIISSASVTYSPNQAVVESVLFQHLGDIDREKKDFWWIKGSFFGGPAEEGLRLIRGGKVEERVEYAFEKTEGDRSNSCIYRFEISVMAYELAKEKFPELPVKGEFRSFATKLQIEKKAKPKKEKPIVKPLISSTNTVPNKQCHPNSTALVGNLLTDRGNVIELVKVR